MSLITVKNLNLRNIPTSKLLFYSVYHEQSGVSKENIDREIHKRVYRMNLDSVERDFDIIQSRGSNLDDYTFDFSRGLVGTTESFYRHVNPYNEDVGKQLADFTFSELALAIWHFSSVSSLYQLRDKEVKKKLHNGDIYITSGISDFRKDNVMRVFELNRLREENRNMMRYFDSLSHCFFDTCLSSYNLLDFIRELRVCSNKGGCISSEIVEEYKNLNNDVYYRDLSVAEKFPKMYIKK